MNPFIYSLFVSLTAGIQILELNIQKNQIEEPEINGIPALVNKHLESENKPVCDVISMQKGEFYQEDSPKWEISCRDGRTLLWVIYPSYTKIPPDVLDLF